MKKLLLFTLLSSSIIWTVGQPSTIGFPASKATNTQRTIKRSSSLPSVPCVARAEVKPTPMNQIKKNQESTFFSRECILLMLATHCSVLTIATIIKMLIDFS